MFGIGFPELLLVLVVVLIVFGPDKLPEAARRLGKFTGSMRKTSDALRREFYNAVYEPTEDIRSDARRAATQLKSLGTDLQSTLDRLQKIPDDLKTCEEKELEAKTREKLAEKQDEVQPSQSAVILPSEEDSEENEKDSSEMARLEQKN